MEESKEAVKARVRAKVAAGKALPASERIANVLHATHTHAEAQALIDVFRAEVRREVLCEAEGIAERHKEKHFKFGNYDEGHGAGMVADSFRIQLRRMADTAGEDAPAGGEYTRTEDRIVAYRDCYNPSVLMCLNHGRHWECVVPINSDELPDGGICTFGRLSSLACDRDVLAVAEARGAE